MESELVSRTVAETIHTKPKKLLSAHLLGVPQAETPPSQAMVYYSPAQRYSLNAASLPSVNHDCTATSFGDTAYGTSHTTTTGRPGAGDARAVLRWECREFPKQPRAVASPGRCNNSYPGSVCEIWAEEPCQRT